MATPTPSRWRSASTKGCRWARKAPVLVACTLRSPAGGAVVTMQESVKRVQAIIDAGRAVRKDIFFLSHGGPISSPDDAAYINQHTDCVGFVGASSLERLAVENSLTELTRKFKAIPVKA